MRYLIISILAISFFSCTEHEGNGRNTKSGDTPARTKQPPNPYADIDISPMDMSYFPRDYPQLKMSDSIHTPPVMRVIYSRPHKQGRVIFGGLLKYGTPWRLGANEASEIEFFRSVTIQDNKINPGRYIIYCIPYEDKWAIVLNQNSYTWGLKIDTTKDFLRFTIPVKQISPPVEYFSMVFQKTSTGAELVMAWDVIEARLPINF